MPILILRAARMIAIVCDGGRIGISDRWPNGSGC